MSPRGLPREPLRVGGAIRRGVDLVVLVLVAPAAICLVAILAAAVRIDSRGPVFISLRRMGKGARPIRVWKLRTMVRDAEERKHSLQHLNVLPFPDFKIPHDPRVTRVGRWLRKTSLDELPQLWNLVRGEITLVGPRPCSIAVDKYSLWQTERLEATPGLLGKWQAHGRNQADFDDRCRMDIGQIRDGSAVSEVAIAARTVRAVLTPQDSY
jgi:lipopolysaccharide/colanic/teichoic acid biosynthesis glycosyltransferase